MRIDSCRNCGMELQVTQLCSHCVQPLHFECNNCNAFVDDPIHQHKSLSQSLLSFSEGLMTKRDMSANDIPILESEMRIVNN